MVEKLACQNPTPLINTGQTLQLPVLLLMTTKHLGNLLVALHCLQRLAKASAGQSLVVIDESYRDIIESVDGLGKVLYYPRRRLKTAGFTEKVKLTYRFYRQLRQHRAKLLLDLDGQGLATTVTRLSGVKQRIGPPDAHRSKGIYTALLGYDNNDNSNAHRFHGYALFPRAYLGETIEPQYPPLNNTQQYRDDVEPLLVKNHIAADAAYACIHVGATKAYKQWPPKNYAIIADWLAKQGLHVIFIGAGKVDTDTIDEVQKHCLHKHFSLCNQLSLRQLITLFQQCQLFLGNDSGPMHLAAAAGARVHAIFGPSNDTLWRPLGDKSQVIRHPIPCESNCSTKFCAVNRRCINTLPPEQVKTALQVKPQNKSPITDNTNMGQSPAKEARVVKKNKDVTHQ